MICGHSAFVTRYVTYVSVLITDKISCQETTYLGGRYLLYFDFANFMTDAILQQATYTLYVVLHDIFSMLSNHIKIYNKVCQ